jgi:hypothetical protein
MRHLDECAEAARQMLTPPPGPAARMAGQGGLMIVDYEIVVVDLTGGFVVG